MLAGVRFSPKGLPSSTFLLRIALAADVTAESVPAVNENHEKVSSLSDASETPRMIGTSDAYTGIGRNSRKTAALINADHTGSVALRTWVNEIAPRPNEMTPPTCVPASSTPDGASSLIDFHESRGVLRSPVDQRRKRTGSRRRAPRRRRPRHRNAVSTSLLPMLYAVFRKYHAKNSTPRRTVRLRSERSSGSSMQTRTTSGRTDRTARLAAERLGRASSERGAGRDLVKLVGRVEERAARPDRRREVVGRAATGTHVQAQPSVRCAADTQRRPAVRRREKRGCCDED